MSVMNLADHEQLLIGAGCLPTWLQGMLGMLTGATEDAEDQAPAGPTEGGPIPPEPPAARTEPHAGDSPAPLPKRQRAARAGT